ncbi:MAG TPA: ABC transporter ATP-binding protein [Acetobacteraceae bacterium]|nr:ABC transporter ATP-binding protein [Acetobacteraceae bacterium]
MPEVLIEARGIVAGYGVSRVLHGVDLVLKRGEAVGLMGRNGMGKTTLLRSILGLLPLQAGEVKVRGVDMTGAPAHRIARAGIAYVPEGRGIFADLSVEENLLMAARPGCDGRRDWTLARVLSAFPRLAQRLRHGGQQLSGGEQQMLTVGRALMTNPDVLILDEATEGLAPLVARDIWAILRQLRDTGLSTIIVDKNFAVVSALADHNIVLVKGRIVLDGSALDLKRDPQLLQRHLGI